MTDLLEETKKMMDEYAGYTHQRELLKSEKEKFKNEVIPSVIHQELESIEEEFSPREKALDENEKKFRKQLDARIYQLAKTLEMGKEDIKLKTELATLTIFKPEVEWNTEGLDALILAGNTELLKYRKESRPKTRLTKNNL
jgi:hypothetical protein